MTSNRRTITLIILLSILPAAPAGHAQSLAAFRTRLDQLEEKLKALETAQKRDLQRVQGQLSKAPVGPNPASLDSALAALGSRMDLLALDVGRVKTAAEPGGTNGATDGLRGELMGLVAELRATVEKSAAEARKTPELPPAPAPPKAAAQGPESKVSGYAFGDYYYIASSSGVPNGVATPNGPRQNAFQIRRIYLQFDQKFDDRFSARLRFEMNDPGFGKTDRMSFYVKNAFVKYAHAKSGTNLSIGLVGTPTWENSETIWGYRSVEKTILDLQSATLRGVPIDFGLSIQGRFDRAGKVGYSLAMGNGTGTRPENDNKKRVYGALLFRPVKGFLLETYGDFEPAKDGRDAATAKGLAGFSNPKFRVGLEGFYRRVNRGSGPAPGQEATGVSGYCAGRMNPRVWAFGRVDWFEPNRQAPADRSYTLIAGVDLQPIKDVHLMPNLYVIRYQKTNVNDDYIPRITFFYTF